MKDYNYIPIANTQGKYPVNHPRCVLQPCILLKNRHDIVPQRISFHVHLPSPDFDSLLFVRLDGENPQILPRGVQTRHCPRAEARMTVPSYEEICDFFPSLVHFDSPVIAVVASLGPQNLANGFPVSDVYVSPGGGFGLGEWRLGHADIMLNVSFDGRAIGVVVESAE